MKLYKTFIVILIVLLSTSAVFSQDGGNGAENNTSANTVNNESGSGLNSTTAAENKADEQKTAGSNVAEKQKTAEKKQKTESQKKDLRDSGNIEKTVTSASETGNNSDSNSDLLLFINEGNYKYKRIPDIKLTEKDPSKAEISQQGNTASDNVQDSGDKGFFGLSKNTADIVAKGGILLLILIIFTIYKVRSRGHGRRSSGSSVMNSFRK